MQRTLFGIRSLPLVSYESVFLYCLAADLGMVASPREDDPRCCKMRSSKVYCWTEQEAIAARFSANFAMLLAQTKLDDDVQDSRSIVAKCFLRWLRRPIAWSREYFCEFDPGFDESIRKCLHDHAELERSSEIHSLERYVAPTSSAFSHVFRLFHDVLTETEDGDVEQRGDLFSQVGTHVGAALIAFDCAVDWNRDRSRGEYNPLGSEAEIGKALAFAIQKLTAAGWMIADLAGESSTASKILRHRIHCISQQRSKTNAGNSRKRSVIRSALVRAGVLDCDCLCVGCDAIFCVPECGGVLCDPTSRTSQDESVDRKKRRKRLRAKQNTRGGFCDCDCGCDGCDLCELGSDCVTCQPHCKPDMCCEAYFQSCCDTGAQKTQETNQATDTDVRDDLVGKQAVACTLLAPFGTIEIDGAEYPAKTESGPIEEGETLVVVRREPFGLVVRREP